QMPAGRAQGEYDGAMKTMTIVGFLSSAGALVACGTSQKDACVQFAQASCDALQRCDPNFVNVQFRDLATCDTRIEMFCNTQFPTESAVRRGDMVACAQAIPNATCSELLINDRFAFDNLPECASPAGKRTDGTVCFTDGQCASGYCDRAGSNPFSGPV